MDEDDKPIEALTPEERFLGFKEGDKRLRKTLMQNEILQSGRQIAVMQGILQGKSRQQIADELGIKVTGVYNLERSVLKEFTRDLGFKIPHYQAIQNARIEEVMPKVYAAAIEGDLSAVDRFIALSKRQADLLGLDAPKKVAQTDPSGTKEFGSLTFEERLSQINSIIQQAVKRGVKIQDHPPDQVNSENNNGTGENMSLPEGQLYWNEPDIEASPFYDEEAE